MLRQIIGISVVAFRAINLFQVSGSSVWIELLPDESFYELKPTLKTIKFSEKSENSESGTSYEQKLSCNVTVQESNNKLINNLECSRLIVKIEYSTGEIEIMGTSVFPVFLTANINIDNSSVYKFEFVCKTIHRLLKLVEK
ncbi:hypothetical protein [uncultured Sanguibacteroides sp.]|uniref:hypothetical protein n=1 Tax=uncultured Sanguibacteroides sp. TaxID=1635151 RepID=UPI0025F7E530|nr:hypothetical protein [uncultured Sanguibacteroides sp.]